MALNLLEWSTTITHLSWSRSIMQITFTFYPFFHFPQALSHCKYKPFIKSTEFFLFRSKFWLNRLPATQQLIYHTAGKSIYIKNTFKNFLFEVVCLQSACITWMRMKNCLKFLRILVTVVHYTDRNWISKTVYLFNIWSRLLPFWLKLRFFDIGRRLLWLWPILRIFQY